VSRALRIVCALVSTGVARPTTAQSPSPSPSPSHRPRVAPVLPSCPPETLTLEVDAVGNEDQCVSRTPPRCRTGETLEVDAAGEADRCIADDSRGGAAPHAGRKPVCRGGLELKSRAGADVCERIERPRCPSGFTLSLRRGPDRCNP